MKKFLILSTVLVLTAALLIFFVIYLNDTTECDEHKDYNEDRICDICNKETALNHTTHNDADGNNFCDICGEKFSAEITPDTDTEPNPPSGDCIDKNEDGICDLCGKEIPTSQPPDTTENPDMPCEVCIDGNKDSVCDSCGKQIQISEAPDDTDNEDTPCETCIDKNNDTVCDICNSEIKQKDYPITSVTINGKDITPYVIAYDSSHGENKVLALKIQTLIFDSLGLSLNIIDIGELTDENYIAVKSGARSGGDGFYVKIKGENLEIISEFSNKTVSTGEKYFSDLFKGQSGAVDAVEMTVNVRDIYYKDFGAVGDGIENDYEAIKKTHDYANQYGHSVISESGATYYIGSAAESIIIRTDVNWSDSTFIIDDRDISARERSISIFKIASDYDCVSFDAENEYIKEINNFGALTSDIKRIDLKLGYPALLVIENSNRKNYISYGENENTAPHQKEMIIVDKDGFIDNYTPLTHSYSEVTAITAYRIDDVPITLTGAKFIRKSNAEICDGSYYERNILVCRSNVTLERIRYEVTGESENLYLTNPYTAFLSIINSNNITISNCTLTAHKISYIKNQSSADTPLESYVLSASLSNNITWCNCFQSNFYSIDGITPDTELSDIMKSEYSKNLNYQSSVLSTFTAHKGVYNISIKNSTLTSIDAVGAGTLQIDNSYVYNDVFLNLAEEYGSYWNGDIVIRNSSLLNTKAPTLIGMAWYNRNFGYQTYMPKNIIIDNLSCTNGTSVLIFDNRFSEQSENLLKDSIDGSPNLNKTLPTESIIIKNNTAGLIFSIPDTEYFNNTLFSEE